MKVDLFRRPAYGGGYAYLAVPHGKPIPHEATSIEWESDDANIDLDEANVPIHGLPPDDALEQIDDKGYAITSVHVQAHRIQ